MTVRVALVGFGRIGRNVCRLLSMQNDIQIAAINDLADAKTLAYLFQYDSEWGRSTHHIALEHDILHIGKHQAAVNLADLSNIDIVVDATDKPRSRAELEQYLQHGVKKVLVCSPLQAGKPDGFFNAIKPAHQIISMASPVVHAGLPLINILEQNFGIERLFYTEVHAYTQNQRLADAPADDLRCARAAAENVVPTSAQSEALFLDMLPHLQGSISSMAFRIPVISGCMLDMVAFTKKPVSVASMNDAVRAAAATTYQNIIEYSTDPIVSSDVKQSPYSATFDSLATMHMGTHSIKAIAFHDSTWGFANRVVEVLQHFATTLKGASV